MNKVIVIGIFGCTMLVGCGVSSDTETKKEVSAVEYKQNVEKAAAQDILVKKAQETQNSVNMCNLEDEHIDWSEMGKTADKLRSVLLDAGSSSGSSSESSYLNDMTCNDNNACLAQG